jgi:predicted dehydrogenase
MAERKARIGVIGTGWWSTTAHLPALEANPDADLVALADRRTDVLEKAAAICRSVNTYSDFHDMLAKEKLDGVVVAVNHSGHYEVAKACLDAGLHVLLEKPMVLEAAHAHDLMNTAKARGVELIVGYPWHYTETTQKAREIIQSGELGRIQFVSCLFSSMVIEFYRGNDKAYAPVFGYPVTGPGTAYSDPKLSGGGQGHLQVTHSAGSMFFVTGLQAERVTAFMENLDVSVDVVDAMAVRFKPVDGQAVIGTLGSTGNIGVGDGGIFDLQVYCEHGRLALEQITGMLYVRKADGTEMRYGPPADTYPKSDTSKNLVDVILGRAENKSPAEVGVRVVELLDAAYRSAAADGKPVNVSELQAKQ